jgi:hypothetical protein
MTRLDRIISRIISMPTESTFTIGPIRYPGEWGYQEWHVIPFVDGLTEVDKKIAALPAPSFVPERRFRAPYLADLYFTGVFFQELPAKVTNAELHTRKILRDLMRTDFLGNNVVFADEVTAISPDAAPPMLALSNYSVSPVIMPDPANGIGTPFFGQEIPYRIGKEYDRISEALFGNPDREEVNRTLAAITGQIMCHRHPIFQDRHPHHEGKYLINAGDRVVVIQSNDSRDYGLAICFGSADSFTDSVPSAARVRPMRFIPADVYEAYEHMRCKDDK